MRKLMLVFSAPVLLVSPAQAQITYGESVPVQLEAIEDIDACSLGLIADVGDDSSALVLSGPSSDYDTVDFLSDDQYVWVCQTDGDYYGIVYTTDEDLDCEVSSPVEFTVNYSGECDTGWVKSDWVEILAG